MMEMDVTNRERNELMNREEIALELNHTGEPTPSENQLRKKLAAELDLDPLTIQVDHVYSRTGSGTSTAHVKVFDEPIMDELPEDDTEADEDSEESSESATSTEEPDTEDAETAEEEQEEEASTEEEESEEDTEEEREDEESEDSEDEEEDK